MLIEFVIIVFDFGCYLGEEGIENGVDDTKRYMLIYPKSILRIDL